PPPTLFPSPTLFRSPADLVDKVEQYHAELVEAVAETDEELLEKYLGGEELTPEEIKKGVRALTVAGEAYPVFCGTAFKNKGVQPDRKSTCLNSSHVK